MSVKRVKTPPVDKDKRVAIITACKHDRYLPHRYGLLRRWCHPLIWVDKVEDLSEPLYTYTYDLYGIQVRYARQDLVNQFRKAGAQG